MKRWICLFLSVILLVGGLISCKKEEPATPQEDSEVVSETETVIASDPISDYTIVYPASASSALKENVLALGERLELASGAHISVKADTEEQGSGKEILVGRTNRSESDEVYGELGDGFRFIHRQIEDKLVVAAPTAELLQMALEYLTENHMKQTGDGSYPLEKAISHEGEELPYAELVTEGKLNYQLVYPANASTFLVKGVTALKDALGKVADTSPRLLTDSNAEAKTIGAIVLGEVNLQGISEIVKSLPPLGYQVSDGGGQIYYVGQGDATMVNVCYQLAEKISSGLDEKGTVRLYLPIGETVYAHDWMEPIPEIPSDTGVSYSLEECSTDVFRFYYRNSSREKFDRYTDSLEDAGFVLYAENQIGEHVYRTYQKNQCMVHAYYTHTTKDFRVLVGEMNSYDLTPVTDGMVTEPVFSLMALDYTKQAGNGLGMIFTMKDGSFVIVDGGWGYDTQGLYEYLVANNRRDDGILIRAWIITHPHDDHYGNVVKIASTYASKVKVEKFVANFAEGTYARDGSADDDIAIILPALEKFVGAEFLIPQVGQKMYFGELLVEFLYTIECAYPANSSVVIDANNHSLCAKMDFYGKSILMMGDSYGVPCNYLVETFGSYIQADYLQVPHHNGNGGSSSFYSLVKPKVILVSTTQERYEATVGNSEEPLYYLVKRMTTVKKVYVADNGYKVVE